ncbi:Lrp/AsnC family transcriptional regulator [Actinomadura parmotrematis]|uniref:Lrp/AsnC family transcriptional regulator n=1 Tax=Actinomadura parmotrematis TaxID=2864039 RepID=A0ABS7FQ53_9ACTN|nr:Lrp/AsnC family transcriptional regulator [Actinomadura parmotrematis]MBW8481884.1 Lrp/AsnC family transcriptional regulator [Actinomadura parmotrematis]
MTVNLDATDWAILTELQRDGRVSLTELGRRVSLSTSAATERVRRLETAGVITGYHARVDLAKAGLPVTAVVRLKYPGNRHTPLHDLLRDREEILECLRTTGEDCYVLKVAAPSLAHLERTVDELLELGSTTTNLVYSEPLPYRGLPARPPAPLPDGRGDAAALRHSRGDR